MNERPIERRRWGIDKTYGEEALERMLPIAQAFRIKYDDLLAALEALDPTHQGDHQGAAYWLAIHLHPLHRREDDCPWCQRDTAICEAVRPTA